MSVPGSQGHQHSATLVRKGKEGRWEEANSKVSWLHTALQCTVLYCVLVWGNCGLYRQRPHTMDTGYVKVTGLEEEKEEGGIVVWCQNKACLGWYTSTTFNPKPCLAQGRSVII